VPYVGADVKASSLCMDKDLFKAVMRDAGIPVTRNITLRPGDAVENPFGYPVFVKPARLGSSVGISKVREEAELEPAVEVAREHDEKVLVEEFVPGVEIEVGVLGNRAPIASLPGQVVSHFNDWYDYSSKYDEGGSDLLVPPPTLTAAQCERAQQLAVEAFVATDCEGMARVDFFVREPDGEVIVNELNTIPGFTATSFYSRLFEASGLPYRDLLDRLVELMPPDGDVAEEDEDVVRLAVIGRPNVGKSSLVNAFLGTERVIVSEQAGTTRDAIDTELELDGRPARLIDTAGLRRRTKVAGTVDYYAQLRSERAAERADVAIIVCDASEGVTAEDLRVAELAMRTGCATLVALNKWDLIPSDDADDLLRDAKARIGQRVRQRPPVVTASAKTGRGVAKLLAEAVRLADRRAERISTSELNRFVGEVVAAHPPPARRGRRLRLYYAAQIEVAPPRIAIQVNDRRLITRDWAYHLENRLRSEYTLDGVPLVIDFVPKRKRTAV
jgi:GTP-binding protein